MKADRFVRMPQTAWIYPLLAALFYVAASVLGFGNQVAPGAIGICLRACSFP
ncbi:hypothetical protein [Rhizobium lusitanum]|uniref:hypothetical protein n=1 Tax=Rhizobium lusitanum TaxID=293958 RepID=UPI0032B2A1E9